MPGYRLARPSAQASVSRKKKPPMMGKMGPGQVGPAAMKLGPPHTQAGTGPPQSHHPVQAPAGTPPAPAPPPQSAQGAATRNTANVTYSTAVGGYKNQLVQAALRLGSPDVIQALMRNPDYAEYAGVLQQGMNDPNSQMATIGRQETQGLKSIDDQAGQGNTYFSGLRLTDRNNFSQDIGAQRSSALNDFRMGPEADTATGLGGAMTDYNTAMNQALGLDINTALEPDPESRSTPNRKPTKSKQHKAKKKPRIGKK